MKRSPNARFLRIGHRARVHLDGLAHGGDAVGRADGHVWFVSLGAPGEVVLAEVTEAHASYVRARIVEVIEPSADRRSPRCVHFGVCGGCKWQHVAASAQRRAKTELVAGALRKLTQAAMPDDALQGDEYGYRVRTELHVVRDGDAARAGYRGARSHDLATPTECPVLDPVLMVTVLALVRLVDVVPGAAAGRYELLVGDEGIALCAHVAAHEASAAVRWLGRVLEDLPNTAACVVEDDARVRLTLRDARVRRGDVAYSAGVFAQSHAGASSALRDTVVQLARPAGAPVLELFAGAGFFSVPLARAARRLVTVEEHPLACADARANLAAESLRADVRQGIAARQLAQLEREGARFDVVVLDPPRTGAADAMPGICDLSPKRVVYVSCDAMTLARDVTSVKPRGYRVSSLRAFDLFPQTPHVEVVALLERVGL